MPDSEINRLERAVENVQRTVLDADRKNMELMGTTVSRLDAVEKVAASTNHLLTGNGDPDKGLIMKVDRIQRSQGNMVKFGWLVISAIVATTIPTTLALLFAAQNHESAIEAQKDRAQIKSDLQDYHASERQTGKP